MNGRRGRRAPAAVLRVLAAASLATTAVLLATASPAGAHARLLETSPAADTVLDEAPPAVELRFSEPVDPELGGVDVIDPSGSEVDSEPTADAGAAVVRVPVESDAQGSFTVVWSVVSEDGHTISGSFVYSVGQESAIAELDDDGRAGTRLLAGVGRWLAFAGTLGLAGALAYAALVLPSGGPDAGPSVGRRLRVLAVGAGGVAVLGAALALWGQVAIASGDALLSAWGSLADAVADTRLGRLGLVRLVLAVVALAAVAKLHWQHGRGRAWLLALVPVAGLLVVPALAGHAWTTSPTAVAVALDVVHLTAASVWIGGLAALAVTAPGSGAAPALARRFSAVALASVAVVVVTGAITSVLQVESFDGLFDTGYGRLLLLKVAGVAALVALGYANRRRLLALLPERGTLWSVVRAEVAIALLVLAITAALVNRPPAGADAAADAGSASSGPYNEELVLADQPAEGSIDVTVDPAQVGTNDIHLYFFDGEGVPRPVDAIEVRVSRAGVPPRAVEVTPFTADHASALGVTFPTAGGWTVEITTVYRSEASTAATEVPIR